MPNVTFNPEKMSTGLYSVGDASALVTLSGSWQLGTAVLVLGHATAFADIEYDDGTETALQVRFMGSADGGTTYRPILLLDTHSSGVTRAYKHIISMYPAQFDNVSSGVYDGGLVTVSCAGLTHVRADVIADTPGGGAGTVRVKFLGGFSV